MIWTILVCIMIAIGTLVVGIDIYERKSFSKRREFEIKRAKLRMKARK